MAYVDERFSYLCLQHEMGMEQLANTKEMERPAIITMNGEKKTRIFQQQALAFMTACEKDGLKKHIPELDRDVRGGAQCAPTGVGKTFLMIMLCAQNRLMRELWNDVLCTEEFASKQHTYIPANLIVCPKHIISNWINELKLAWPQAAVYRFMPPKSILRQNTLEQKDGYYFFKVCPQKSDLQPEAYCLADLPSDSFIIVSWKHVFSELPFAIAVESSASTRSQSLGFSANKNRFTLSKYLYGRVIIDEGQFVGGAKTRHSQMSGRLHSLCRWFQSATPINPGHEVADFQRMASFLQMRPFCTDRLFWSSLVENKQYVVLKQFLKHFMWCHTHKQVKNQMGLPPITIEEIPVALSLLEREYYNTTETNDGKKFNFCRMRCAGSNKDFLDDDNLMFALGVLDCKSANILAFKENVLQKMCDMGLSMLCVEKNNPSASKIIEKAVIILTSALDEYTIFGNKHETSLLKYPNKHPWKNIMTLVTAFLFLLAQSDNVSLRGRLFLTDRWSIADLQALEISNMQNFQKTSKECCEQTILRDYISDEEKNYYILYAILPKKNAKVRRLVERLWNVAKKIAHVKISQNGVIGNTQSNEIHDELSLLETTCLTVRNQIFDHFFNVINSVISRWRKKLSNLKEMALIETNMDEKRFINDPANNASKERLQEYYDGKLKTRAADLKIALSCVDTIRNFVKSVFNIKDATTLCAQMYKAKSKTLGQLTIPTTKDHSEASFLLNEDNLQLLKVKYQELNALIAYTKQNLKFSCALCGLMFDQAHIPFRFDVCKHNICSFCETMRSETCTDVDHKGCVIAQVRLENERSCYICQKRIADDNKLATAWQCGRERCECCSWKLHKVCPMYSCRNTIQNRILCALPQDLKLSVQLVTHWNSIAPNSFELHAIETSKKAPYGGRCEGAKIKAIVNKIVFFVQQDDAQKKPRKYLVFESDAKFRKQIFTSIHAKIKKHSKKCQVLLLANTMETSETTIEEFTRYKHSAILILDPKTTAGMHLVDASCVIMCSPSSDPAVLLQAQSRSHRFGQKNPVTVVQFYVSDSVEEKLHFATKCKMQSITSALASKDEPMSCKHTQIDLHSSLFPSPINTSFTESSIPLSPPVSPLLSPLFFPIPSSPITNTAISPNNIIPSSKICVSIDLPMTYHSDEVQLPSSLSPTQILTVSKNNKRLRNDGDDDKECSEIQSMLRNNEIDMVAYEDVFKVNGYEKLVDLFGITSVDFDTMNIQRNRRGRIIAYMLSHGVKPSSEFQ